MSTAFTFADEAALTVLLPQLFRILHTNMSAIAPTGGSYEEDFAVWRQSILPAMQAESRQMVLFHRGKDLAGYFQYSIDGELWLMEEIQIKPEYQGTGLFRELYQWLEPRLPAALKIVEAYSHKSNLKSQAVLEHLGLSRVGENRSGSSWHYRGSCQELWERVR